MAQMYMSEENLLKGRVLFHCVVHGDRTLVISLGGKHLYQMSHFTDPVNFKSLHHAYMHNYNHLLTHRGGPASSTF